LEDTGPDVPVAPWVDDRFQLWSLLDMLRFYATTFIGVMRDLEMTSGLLTLEVMEGRGDKPVIDHPPHVLQEPLAAVTKELSRLPLSRTLRFKAGRLCKRMSDDPMLTQVQAEVLVKEFYNDIVMELATHLFLFIPADRRELYQQAEPPFGGEVEQTFPDAVYDIAAGTRCLSVDEWTGSVFHMMRVLEIGLRRFAEGLGVQMESGIELENWKSIIDQIEKAIRSQEQQPKSPEKSAQLQFYSEAASNLRYFKDAWRNHVSHSRAKYDELEATTVWRHVRSFMQRLAEGL
jgi:hypothetical protein